MQLAEGQHHRTLVRQHDGDALPQRRPRQRQPRPAGPQVDRRRLEHQVDAGQQALHRNRPAIAGELRGRAPGRLAGDDPGRIEPGGVDRDAPAVSDQDDAEADAVIALQHVRLRARIVSRFRLTLPSPISAALISMSCPHSGAESGPQFPNPNPSWRAPPLHPIGGRGHPAIQARIAAPARTRD